MAYFAKPAIELLGGPKQAEYKLKVCRATLYRLMQSSPARPVAILPKRYEARFEAVAAAEGIDLEAAKQMPAAALQTIHDLGPGVPVCVVHWAGGVEISRAALTAEQAIAQGLELARAGLRGLNHKVDVVAWQGLGAARGD